jgi:hypothetical protein
MLLLLRLAGIGKVGHDSWAGQSHQTTLMEQSLPVIDLAEPPLQAETMISNSMTESLILQTSAITAIADMAGGLLFAPTLHDENVFVSNGSVCNR